ncbi:MAG: hypothetical protein ACYCUY_12025 [Acidithiobacillus sp.]
MLFSIQRVGSDRQGAELPQCSANQDLMWTTVPPVSGLGLQRILLLTIRPKIQTPPEGPAPQYTPQIDSGNQAVNKR